MAKRTWVCCATCSHSHRDAMIALLRENGIKSGRWRCADWDSGEMRCRPTAFELLMSAGVMVATGELVWARLKDIFAGLCSLISVESSPGDDGVVVRVKTADGPVEAYASARELATCPSVARLLAGKVQEALTEMQRRKLSVFAGDAVADWRASAKASVVSSWREMRATGSIVVGVDLASEPDETMVVEWREAEGCYRARRCGC